MTTIHSDKAPEPVGLYPHAKRVGNLLFLSGVGDHWPLAQTLGVESGTTQAPAPTQELARRRTQIARVS